MKYPKINTVNPLKNKQLLVGFDGGAQKIYDCSPLLLLPAFEALQQEWFFNLVQVDQGGYGVSWSDDVDLAESELWLNGVEVRQTSSQVYLSAS